MIIANLADRDLLDSDLSTMLLVNTLVYVAKGAMSYHLSKLPLRDWKWLLCVLIHFWVLLQVILHLLIAEVAIFVVFLEVVLVLFVV